jgi:hypothetical protein
VKRAQVGTCGTFGVVAVRDLLAGHFFEMGHKDLSRNLHRWLTRIAA